MIEGDALKIEGHDNVNWWVITSQTCNLYNGDFAKVPTFEVIAAKKIDTCQASMIKGDNPRILHVEARSSDEKIAIELDIQKRHWFSRKYLAEISGPKFNVSDANRETEPGWLKNQWRDNLAGWLARSYTRVALPDDFNVAMTGSRLKAVLEEKLTKHKDQLYGIYFSLGYDGEDEWTGVLGFMPPPYHLEIVLAVHEDVDTILIKEQLVKQIFKDELPDPISPEEDPKKKKKITRAELAKRYNVRIIQAGIEVKSVAEITLLELKSLIRYSLVDHLSNSSMAAA